MILPAGTFDGTEKPDELLVGVPWHAAPDTRAVEDVEGGEQGGGAVAPDADSLGHPAAGPMGGGLGRLSAGQELWPKLGDGGLRMAAYRGG
jgi:hypothetical protein